MAIKRFGDYETTQAYSDFQQLPRGGYVLKIMGASVESNSNGQYVKISCDVVEGEYANFYANDYRSQQSEDKKWRCNYLLNIPNDDGTERDGWTKRRFKTVVEAIEDSNPGYHFDWDEKKFKGKLIGGLFNEREYESRNGEIRRATSLAQLCTVEKIRSGEYTIPADKLLQKNSVSSYRGDDDFVSVPLGASGDALPFD